MCTPPALKPNTYIQTLHRVQSHSSSIPFLSHSFHPHCAGGSRSRTGDPMRGGSYDGLLLVWTLGNSSGKVRVQRGSRSRVLLIPRRSAQMGAEKVTRSGSQAHSSYLSTRHNRGPSVPSGYGPDTLGPAPACLRAARRSESSQGSPPFDISRITHSCVITQETNLDCPTRDQGRVGGRNT